MKNSFKVITMLASVALLTVVACSETKKTTKKGTSSLQKASKFYDTYRITEARCDTGRKEFGSNKSADEVKKQLCETLKDAKKNNNCAEASRKDLFAKKCSTFAWNSSTPVIAPVPTVGTIVSTKPTVSTTVSSIPLVPPKPPVTDVSKINDSNWTEYKPLSDAISNMLAEKYEISKSINAEQVTVVQKYFEDIANCGFSKVGAQCLDSEVTSSQLTGSFNKAENLSYIYVELMVKETPLIHILRVEQIEPLKLGRLEVFQMLKKRGTTDIATYLADSTNIQLWGTAVISNSTKELATKRQGESKNLRELYHTTKLLLTGGNEKVLKENINLKVSYFTDSADEKYLMEFLNLLSTFSDSQKSFIEIYKALGHSKIEAVRNAVVNILFALDPLGNAALKPLVILNLTSPNWQDRQTAVKALAAASPTPEDEITIIKMLADSQKEVADSAEGAVRKMNLTTKHQPAIMELAKNKNATVRVRSIVFLIKLSDRAVIEMLTDANVQVVQTASNALMNTKLDTSYLLDLAAKMTLKDWTTRLATAEVINTMDSDNATTVLIKFVNDDQYEVFSKINSMLQKRSIKDLHLSLIQEKLKSQNWVIRDYMVALLAKNNSAGAKKILKDQYAKETNAEVKADIKKVLGL